MRWSDPGNIVPTMLRPAGVSATHGAPACRSQKIAPVSRIERSTSEGIHDALRGRWSMNDGLPVIQ